MGDALTEDYSEDCPHDNWVEVFNRDGTSTDRECCTGCGASRGKS